MNLKQQIFIAINRKSAFVFVNGKLNAFVLLSGECGGVSQSMPPLGMHAKLTGTSFFPLLLFSPMPVSHFHAPFQGKGRKKANKQDFFPEFMFSKGTTCAGGRRGSIGGVCGLQLKIVAFTERDLCTLLAKSNK